MLREYLLGLTVAKAFVHHRLTTHYIGPKGKKNKIMAEACEEVIHLEVPRNQCTEREDCPLQAWCVHTGTIHAVP